MGYKSQTSPIQAKHRKLLILSTITLYASGVWHMQCQHCVNALRYLQSQSGCAKQSTHRVADLDGWIQLFTAAQRKTISMPNLSLGRFAFCAQAKGASSFAHPPHGYPGAQIRTRPTGRRALQQPAIRPANPTPRIAVHTHPDNSASAIVD